MIRLNIRKLMLYLSPKLAAIPRFHNCYLSSSKNGNCHVVAQSECGPLSVKSRIALPVWFSGSGRHLSWLHAGT